MKPQLFLALAWGLSAQVSHWSRPEQGETYQAIRRSGQATGEVCLWNGWQPGQSAAIGPESSGYPAKLGAPAERVEASRKFAGGGVGGDTQSREMVPLCSRPGGDEPRKVVRDGDMCNNQPNKGIRLGCRTQRVDRLAAAAEVGLSTIGSAGSTPARLYQNRAGLSAQVIDIPPTANGPVGAERSGMLLGECRGTEPRTERQRPAMEPVKEQKRHTANRHRSTCWPARRADTDARDLVRRGSGSSAIPSAGIQNRAGWWRAHLADSGVHLGATSLDMASSWGRPELNPLLRSADGRFGGKGLAAKLAVFGGVEVIKWRLARRHGKFARALSLGPAGAYAAVAARNWRAR